MLSKKELEIQVLCEEFYQALSQFQNTVIFHKKIDIKNIESAVKLLELNHPEIFWIDGCSVQYNSEEAEVNFKILNHYKPDVYFSRHPGTTVWAIKQGFAAVFVA